jgi:hypothetical protein
VPGNWDETTRAPPQQLDADRILRTLLDHEVEFVIIGGLAVAAHGFPRATKDVDLVPAPADENRRRLYDALLALGAEPLELGGFHATTLPVPFSLVDLDAGGNWALRTHAGRVDVLQRVPGIDGYEQLCAGALEVEVPDVGRLLVAGYDELEAMKRAAGRPQDERDLDELRAIRSD